MAALGDADFVLRHTQLYGQSNFARMSRLDLTARGATAGKVRRGKCLADRRCRWTTKAHTLQDSGQVINCPSHPTAQS